MRYKVRRQGIDLGSFLLEELRQSREAGELAGGDYVQCEGASDWQPLDLVLLQGYSVVPPSPLSVANSWPNGAVVWCVVALGLALFVAAIFLFVNNVRKGYQFAANRPRQRELARPQAVAAASQPISWTTNTLTQKDVSRRAREFRLRQWLDGYEKRGERNAAVDAEAEQFIRVWIARHHGGAEATNVLSLAAESERLAGNPTCADPLVLTVAANETADNAESNRRFDRALALFSQSRHLAYPQLYALTWRAAQTEPHSDHVTELDTLARAQLKKCFTDGSFTPTDQQEIADIFVNGWGTGFFSRNAAAVCQIVQEAGADYQWLALTLDGEQEITAAWAARGSGYADSVTEQGWQGFRDHLKSARTALTQAWNLQPNFPQAPCRMMTVALGDSEDIGEMRTWFDRTVAAQIDYPSAWSEMRWGLRPRWYGNETAMLALGRTAIATGRFDTDVPRKFIDCVYDVEAEEGVSGGRHIFGRSDVWPDVRRLYEGYINQAKPYPQTLRRWRTAYAIIAALGGKYETSRTQLEALDWIPQPDILSEWKLDATLWPLEIAARTGPLGTKISAAETAFNNGDRPAALKKYRALNAADGDERTREFIRRRLASLQTGQ